MCCTKVVFLIMLAFTRIEFVRCLALSRNFLFDIYKLNYSLRSACTRGLGPASTPLKSLHQGTGRRDLSHEQFTRSVLRNKSQVLVPKIQTGLNSWD